MQSLGYYFNRIIELAVAYLPKFLLAVVVLVVGLSIINWATKKIRNMMLSRGTDESIVHYSSVAFGFILKTLLIISVLSMAGIATTSVIALLGALGVGVGLALSGTLQNFAAGLMIFAFKHFKIGDYIEANGEEGTVKEMNILNTIIETAANTRVIIPNQNIINNAVKNYSVTGMRRVEWAPRIAYGDNVNTIKTLIKEILDRHTATFEDPKPQVFVNEMGDSGLNLIARAWCKPENYWNLYFDVQEELYKTFHKENIHIPFPQMDLHLFNNPGNIRKAA